MNLSIIHYIYIYIVYTIPQFVNVSIKIMRLADLNPMKKVNKIFINN